MIRKEFFGKTAAGEEIVLFTFTAGKYEMRAINYGATIVSLTVPDKNGKAVDVVHGFNEIASYEAPCCYFGAAIGRFGNRIARAQFSLGGKTYQLPVNDGKNSLHGGNGFDKKVWSYEELEDAVRFTYVSADGEEGYPGCLTAQVTYSLTEEGVLRLAYHATTDADTLCNLTNHSYFNLSGSGESDTILDHTISVNSDFYTENNAECMPTGQILNVTGCEMDLREGVVLGDQFAKKGVQTELFGGFDNNFIIARKSESDLELAATAESPVSGIVMECWTTLPAVQLYTGNSIDCATSGKHGKAYQKHSAFCLETQGYPDSPNFAHFPSCVLRPGEVYEPVTEYRFSVK